MSIRAIAGRWLMSLTDRKPLRRKPLRRKTALKSGKPLARAGRLRPRSNKRAAQARAFAPIREAVFERDNHTCQAAHVVLSVRCSNGLHPHHLRRQSQGGPDTPENLLSVCPAHHRWIHDNPEDACSRGLLA